MKYQVTHLKGEKVGLIQSGTVFQQQLVHSTLADYT